MKRLLITLLLLCGLSSAETLDHLAQDFWKWRAYEQPFSGDDLPRLERPPNWSARWSGKDVAEYHQQLAEFESRLQKIDLKASPIAQQVDHRLMASAMARVRWELDVTQGYKRNPLFYADQTLGSVFEELIPPPPFTEQRAGVILARLKAFPRVLEEGKANLTDARAPFAMLAAEELKDVRTQLGASMRELKPLLPASSAAQLDAATEGAIRALESYREWLQQNIPHLKQETAIGRDNYIWFLRNVAIMPYSPEELLRIGRQEFERAVAFQEYEEHRNKDVAPLQMFASVQEQQASEQKQELKIRAFMEERGIMSVPQWVQHYLTPPMPAYVKPLTFLGVSDYLTGPSHLKEDGTSYINPPSKDLGYFSLATAHDTRPIIVHEGVPGHYFQLVRSWANPDLIRRHYYDSGANEGVGFYAEEMMLQAGLFDDSPHTREIIYNFMRLRALRVEVDVKLATGEFTIAQGAEYLQKNVPMDADTAGHESAFFATGPGQAITYQIGKNQILRMLADARMNKGEQFSLRDFQDFVWTNGNVPIALQRWEYLGLVDDVPPSQALAPAASR